MSGGGPGDPIAVQPVYPRHEADAARPWRARAEWSVAPRLDHPDAEHANRLALLDLDGGAEALTLVAAGGPGARGFGLSSAEGLAPALAGVELDLVSLRLDAGSAAPAFARALAALAAARRLGSAALDIDLGFDPIALAARGQAPEPGAAAALVGLSADAGFAGRSLLADGRLWHEAGADEAHELALVLATTVAHLRMLQAAGVPLDKALGAVAVLLPFDADVLLGLSKARAMRRLRARLETACGLQPIPLRLHAETSWRMMTRYDPWTNAMRASAACFAAGLGGADTITVLPMTLVLGLPDEAARRLARNTGRVLLDEAHLGKVDDPAAGSGALEALTEELCRLAWGVFQDIERGGGIEAGLREGRIQATLHAAAERRRGEIETLARGIVGTSRFPRLDTPLPAVLGAPRDAEARGRGTLASRRDAEPFEALRDLAEHLAAAGRRPTVFLATLGPPAAFGARASLAANLLAAAGIATQPPPTAALDRDANLAAFRACGTTAACLCGEEAAYRDEGDALTADLRAAGATWVLAVGGKVAGTDGLIRHGADVLHVLRRTLRAIASA